MMKASLWVLVVCLVGVVVCVPTLSEEEPTSESATTPKASSSSTESGGLSGIPVFGGWWNQYGPDKWQQQAQNWMDKAPWATGGK